MNLCGSLRGGCTGHGWLNAACGRWGLACMGCLVGGGLVWQLHQRDIELHRQVAQEVARLEQQLAALPVSKTAQIPLPFPADFPDKLASLPRGDEPAPVWTALHQGLARQGLQWLSLRPVAPTAKPEASVRWPSHAVVVRVKGRFEDWVKAWETLADIGVLCSIDKISIAATAVPAEVQIDAVLRVWMRPIGMPESPHGGDCMAAVCPICSRPRFKETHRRKMAAVICTGLHRASCTSCTGRVSFKRWRRIEPVAWHRGGI